MAETLNDNIDQEQNPEQEPEKGKKEKKKKKFTFMDLLVTLVCGSVFIAGAIYIIRVYAEYGDAAAIYDGIALFVTESTDENADAEEAKEMIEAGFPYLDVDYESLLEVNPEYLGWLYFPLLDISYPVVHGDEAESYLHEAIDGTKTNSGCLYIDAWANPYLKDMTTVIYGHNMRNGSMFGSLKRIRKEDNLVDEDPYFYYYTPTRAYKCRIFCYYLENTGGKTYTYPTDNKTYDEYMDYILSKNEYTDGPSNVDIAHRPKLLTLSTCSGRNTGKRTVVHGAIVDTYEFSDDLVITETFDAQ